MPTTQNIVIDLNTRGANPVAFTHQGDTARSFVFEVYNDGEAFTLTGYTAKIGAMLPADRGYYVIAGDNMATGAISGNKITVTLPAAYTAKSGNGVLTIILTGSGATIRPINVDFRIQKSADAADTVAGASDFPASLAQIVDDWITDNSADTVEAWLEDALSAQDLETIVSDWLEDHPEATTTIEDGSITIEKFASSVVDDTLTEPGHPADAKAVSDKMQELNIGDRSIFPVRPFASIPRESGYEAPQGVAYANGSIYISYATSGNTDALIVKYNASTLAEEARLVVQEGGHGKMCYNAKLNHLVLYPMWYNGETLAYWVFDIPLDLSTYTKITTTECIVNGGSHDGELYLQVNGTRVLRKYTGDFADLETTDIVLPYNSDEVTHTQGFYYGDSGIYHLFADPSCVLVGDGKTETPKAIRNIFNPYYQMHEPEAMCDFSTGQLLLSWEKFDNVYRVGLWRCDVDRGVVFTKDRIDAFSTHVVYVNNTFPTPYSLGTSDNPFHSVEEALHFIDCGRFTKGLMWRILIVAGDYSSIYIRNNVMINANSGAVSLNNVIVRDGSVEFNNCNKLTALTVDAIAGSLVFNDVPAAANASINADSCTVICSSNSHGAFTSLSNSIVRIANINNWTHNNTGTIILGSGTISPDAFT